MLMLFHAVIWSNKVELIEMCVQGQVPGHKILKRRNKQNCPDFFFFFNLSLLSFQCQTI